MKPFLRSRFIAQDDLRRGEWEPSVRAILADVEPTEHMRTDGARIVASAILDVVH
jgi:hypothetical protein